MYSNKYSINWREKNLVSYVGMNLPPLISRVPASVRESKMSTDEENPGAQYNEAGLEKTRV